MTRKTKKPAPGVTALADGRFRVRVTVTCPRTKRKKDVQETLPQGASLGEAIDRRDALRAGATSKPKGKPRFSDFVDDWLDRRQDWKPKTLSGYELALSYSLPILGEIKIDDIRVEDLEELADMMAASPRLSASTGRGYWAKIRRVVRAALLRGGWAGIDPFSVVKAPKCNGGRPRQRVVLQAEQALRLVKALTDMPRNGGTLSHTQRVHEIDLLLGGAFRIGELVGLEWRDVRGTTVIVRPENDKTGRGRTVELTAATAAKLQQWRQIMLAKQHKGLPSGLVFPSPRTGRGRAASSFGHFLKEAAKRAGLDKDLAQRISPHALRRTYNKMALESGADPNALRAQMGHSSAVMTALYTGESTPQERAKVANQVATKVGLKSGTLEGD